MKQFKMSTIKGLFLGTILVLAVSFFLPACRGCNNSTGSNTPGQPADSVRGFHGDSVYMHWVAISLDGTVKETWGGTVTTHAGDSLLYFSPSQTFMAYTIANGTWSEKGAHYDTGDSVYLVACSNGELGGSFFNRGLNPISNDAALENSVVDITALGGSGDTILVKVFAQDTITGAAHADANVQFTVGGVNYGTAAKTGSNGTVLYPKGLAQNTSYVLTVTSSGTSSGTMVVSTTPLTGTSGPYSSLQVYVRY